MRWLNYHHLFYFWVVAREGTITGACRKLGVAPSTISAQLRELENHFDQPLFDRAGRRLVLTDAGRLALEYADQIFALGRELDEAVQGSLDGRPLRLRVGVSDRVPKILTHRLLEPALCIDDRAQLHVFEDRSERLVADLSLHHVDMVLALQPLALVSEGEVTTHALGAVDLSLFATAELAGRLRDGFPQSLHGAPVLLPVPGTQERRDLEGWFNARGLVPDLVAEFSDTALLKVFGGQGHGAFAAPTLLTEELGTLFGAEPIGLLDGLEEPLYAFTLTRRAAHPGVQAILARVGDLLTPPARPAAG